MSAISELAVMAKRFVAESDMAAFASPDAACAAFAAVRIAAHGRHAGETHAEVVALATPDERAEWEKAYLRAGRDASDAVYLAAKAARAAKAVR